MTRKEFIISIKEDLKRVADCSSFAAFCRWMFFPQGSTFPFVFWLRVTQFCKSKAIMKFSLGILSYLIYNHLSIKHGIHVNENSYIGPGLKIVHSNCVYVNCSYIGSNFTVYQSCTLGSQDCEAGRGKIPCVGDNVTIYTGSVVVGDIQIGNNSVIGANSFVNKNVPDNTFVAGVPFRVIKEFVNK